MRTRHEPHQVRPFPKIRRAYLDVLREGHRRHIIHGLVEVDVTEPRQCLEARADDGLSFTGFVAACVARAVDENKMMHAHRWGRRRLVLFDEVDVNLQIEQTQPDGTRIVQSRLPQPHGQRRPRHHRRGTRRPLRGTAEGADPIVRRPVRRYGWFGTTTARPSISPAMRAS